MLINYLRKETRSARGIRASARAPGTSEEGGKEKHRPCVSKKLCRGSASIKKENARAMGCAVIAKRNRGGKFGKK